MYTCKYIGILNSITSAIYEYAYRCADANIEGPTTGPMLLKEVKAG